MDDPPSPRSPKLNTATSVQSFSISKTLIRYCAMPANRSCAECRVTLLDSSQVYASYSPIPEGSPLHVQHQQQQKKQLLLQEAPESNGTSDANNNQQVSPKPRVNQFISNHRQFTPPGYTPQGVEDHEMDPLDPADVVFQRIGHGVFVCAMCGAAHKLMGPSVAQVHPVLDPIAWNAQNVQQLALGNAHSWKVLEAYLPSHWQQRQPKPDTSIAERLTWVRAKYEALAFCMPASGPLGKRAWKAIVDRHDDWKGHWAADLYAVGDLEIGDDPQSSASVRRYSLEGNDPSVLSESGNNDGKRKSAKKKKKEQQSFGLPSRLVDFFAVVNGGSTLDTRFQREHPNLESLQSVEDFLLSPTVTACYPDSNSYEDTDFPEHLGPFVFPDGCRPSSHPVSPTFFTLALTCADGSRLYGGVLRLYDQTLDFDGLKEILVQSGYTGELPDWFDSDKGGTMAMQGINSVHSDIAYLPKCLVVLSHYPFFELWRKFLTQLYRIALVEAPLPIERFIANFVSEVPLPPPGKIEVRFGFTTKDIWSIKRPPETELPMVDFSYRPLFSSLSVSSVLVLMGCLLQETRVALVSKHYALLTPVAEALISLLFPLEWHGMYIPVMPLSMADVLEAPVPFLVGLHAKYLHDTPPRRRPHGVVFVDLDHDVVHLGWEDDDSQGPKPRRTPALPEKEALKLKAKLGQFASVAYVMPDSNKAGSLTTGHETPLPFGLRDPYAVINSNETPPKSVRRRDFFGSVDKAYDDNDLMVPLTGFLSEEGLFHNNNRAKAPAEPAKPQRGFRVRKLLGSQTAAQDLDDDDSVTSNFSQGTGSEAKGFSSAEIRHAFVQFFAALFKNYRTFLDYDGNFRPEDFASSLHVGERSRDFICEVLLTQMFERFIRERVESPNDPEVLLFESIVNPRGGKGRLSLFRRVSSRRDSGNGTDGSKGRLPSSREIFSPPPPSNLGLPDGGQRYQYGSFPDLDPSLYGKVRRPIEWPQHTAKRTIRYSRRTPTTIVEQQNSLLDLAVPQVLPPLSNAIKRRVNALEDALHELSRPFQIENGEHSPRDAKRAKSIDLTDKPRQGKYGAFASPRDMGASLTPEEIVLNARRKASILVAIFIDLQANCRRFIARRQRATVMLLTHPTRSHLLALSAPPVSEIRTDSAPIVEDLAMPDLKEPVVDESPVQPEEPKPSFEEIQSATRIQALHRRKKPYQLYERKRKNCLLLQTFFRSRSATIRFKAIQRIALWTQARARKRLAVLAFLFIRQSVARVQARVRGLIVRGLVRKLLLARSDHYRTQMILLWRKAHTPLSFRTKFWLITKSVTFLRHNMAETEMRRLLKELQLYDNLRQMSAPGHDDIARLSTSMGMNTRIYDISHINLSNLEMDDASEVGAVSISSSTDDDSRRSANRPAPFRSSQERAQVYQKLTQLSSSANDPTQDFYDAFKIGARDKKKKKSLADAIWTDAKTVDASIRVMLTLFPELKTSDDMHFVELSRKGLRNFHTTSVAAELEVRAQRMFENRVRSALTYTASAAIMRMPAIMELLSNRQSDVKLKRKQAIMQSRGFRDWKTCRLGIMKLMANNDLFKKQFHVVTNKPIASSAENGTIAVRMPQAPIQREEVLSGPVDLDDSLSSSTEDPEELGNPSGSLGGIIDLDGPFMSGSELKTFSQALAEPKGTVSEAWSRFVPEGLPDYQEISAAAVDGKGIVPSVAVGDPLDDLTEEGQLSDTSSFVNIDKLEEGLKGRYLLPGDTKAADSAVENFQKTDVPAEKSFVEGNGARDGVDRATIVGSADAPVHEEATTSVNPLQDEGQTTDVGIQKQGQDDTKTSSEQGGVFDAKTATEISIEADDAVSDASHKKQETLKDGQPFTELVAMWEEKAKDSPVPSPSRKSPLSPLGSEHKSTSREWEMTRSYSGSGHIGTRSISRSRSPSATDYQRSKRELELPKIGNPSETQGDSHVDEQVVERTPTDLQRVGVTDPSLSDKKQGSALESTIETAKEKSTDHESEASTITLDALEASLKKLETSLKHAVETDEAEQDSVASEITLEALEASLREAEKNPFAASFVTTSRATSLVQRQYGKMSRLDSDHDFPDQVSLGDASKYDREQEHEKNASEATNPFGGNIPSTTNGQISTEKRSIAAAPETASTNPFDGDIPAAKVVVSTFDQNDKATIESTNPFDAETPLTANVQTNSPDVSNLGKRDKETGAGVAETTSTNPFDTDTPVLSGRPSAKKTPHGRNGENEENEENASSEQLDNGHSSSLNPFDDSNTGQTLRVSTTDKGLSRELNGTNNPFEKKDFESSGVGHRRTPSNPFDYDSLDDSLSDLQKEEKAILSHPPTPSETTHPFSGDIATHDHGSVQTSVPHSESESERHTPISINPFDSDSEHTGLPFSLDAMNKSYSRDSSEVGSRDDSSMRSSMQSKEPYLELDPQSPSHQPGSLRLLDAALNSMPASFEDSDYTSDDDGRGRMPRGRYSIEVAGPSRVHPMEKEADKKLESSQTPVKSNRTFGNGYGAQQDKEPEEKKRDRSRGPGGPRLLSRRFLGGSKVVRASTKAAKVDDDSQSTSQGFGGTNPLEMEDDDDDDHHMYGFTDDEAANPDKEAAKKVYDSDESSTDPYS